MLRLVLLYCILCCVLLAGGLLFRTLQAEGWLLPGKVHATGLPFAGINVDTGAAAADQRQTTLAALRSDGFEWVRLRFDWAALEPQPGAYDWSAADSWISDTIAAGLVPLVVLDGSPAWARAEQDRVPNDNPLAPPANPLDMAEFAAAFAGRYASDVRYYQVWDEPNIAPHWGNRWIEPVAYAQLLKAVAPAIRAADPDAIIATAALAPTGDRGHTAVDEVYFLQRMVAAGVADYFDAIAIQPFGFGHAPDNPRQSLAVLDYQRAAFIRRELAAIGLADKALWGVRFGWNREPNGIWGAVTPQTQADYSADALNLAWSRWPWLEALGWVVDRPPATAADPRWGFALSEQDGAPAPVSLALREWLASALSSARPSTTATQAAPSCRPLPLCLPVPTWGSLLLLGGGVAVVVWRSLAAARLLPWAQWLAGWRRLPWFLQAAGWAGLLLLYYFAVWPPLIGLCWLLWTLLCLAQPRVGLAVAAVLLPFYFQHKDLHLVDSVLAVPPATAAVACLLPAVIVRARRRRDWFTTADAVAVAFLGIGLLSAAGAWQWLAYRQGLLDLVLLPVALWFALRILDDAPFTGTLPGSAPVKGAYVVGLALFAGGVLTAMWGLMVWFGGQGVEVDGVRRLVGPHFSPNHTALYLVRTLFLGIGLAAACYGRAGTWACRPARRRADWTGAVVEGGAVSRTRDVLEAGGVLKAGVVAGVDVVPGTRMARLVGAWLWAASVLVLLALVLTGSRGALLLGIPAGTLVLAWAALRRASRDFCAAWLPTQLHAGYCSGDCC